MAVPVGVLPSRLVWKTRLIWLPDGEKTSDNVFSCYDRIPTCDGQTDKTSCYGIVRTMHTHHAVKIIKMKLYNKES